MTNTVVVRKRYIKRQNSQILRRPQDDKDGVFDMAYAIVDAWQNSQILRRPQDDNDGG